MARVGSFKEFLPTLRANYAYLECGRIIMKEMFIWMNGGNDIPNVEKFLLIEKGWTPEYYKKQFYEDTRIGFSQKGIGKVDITALWRLFQLVWGFFTKKEQEWSDVEKFLTMIKKERNDIVHNIFLKISVSSDDELKTYLQGISTLTNNVIEKFDAQCAGTTIAPTTDFQKSKLRKDVQVTIDLATQEIEDVTKSTHGMGISKDLIEVGYETKTLKWQGLLIKVAGSPEYLAIDVNGSGPVVLNAKGCIINYTDNRVTNNYDLKGADFTGATIQQNITSNMPDMAALDMKSIIHPQ